MFLMPLVEYFYRVSLSPKTVVSSGVRVTVFSDGKGITPGDAPNVTVNESNTSESPR
jgi:hypothetical protein